MTSSDRISLRLNQPVTNPGSMKNPLAKRTMKHFCAGCWPLADEELLRRLPTVST